MNRTCILSVIAFVSTLAAVGAAKVDVFTLEGPVRTNAFKQADFKWAVHSRHDYSKTYVTKLCDLLPIRDAGTIHIDAFHNVLPPPVFHPDGKVTPSMARVVSSACLRKACAQCGRTGG